MPGHIIEKHGNKVIVYEETIIPGDPVKKISRQIKPKWIVCEVQEFRNKKTKEIERIIYFPRGYSQISIDVARNEMLKGAIKS